MPKDLGFTDNLGQKEMDHAFEGGGSRVALVRRGYVPVKAETPSGGKVAVVKSGVKKGS